jgi:hypothetical protein
MHAKLWGPKVAGVSELPLGEWNQGQDTSKGEKHKQKSKARVSNPKEISLKRGLFKKRANLKGMLVGSPKKCVSIAMKWSITPKIAPNPNWGMGVPR